MALAALGLAPLLLLPTVAWADDEPIVAEPADSVALGDPTAGPGSLQAVPLGGDLIPFVGTSARYQGNDLRHLSFNVGGYTGAVDGIEGALAFNLDRHFVHGAQLAGGANINLGELRGIQGAGHFNYVGDGADGVQGAGGANVVVNGLNGVQGAGGANVVVGDLHGLQGAGGANVVTGHADGVQGSAGINYAGSVEGVQVAPVNISTGDVRGLQLGVVNIAEQSDASIGLVNIIWRGRTHVDAWAGEHGFVEVGLKHGSRAFHSLLTAGWRPWGDCPEWSVGLGTGAHAPLGERFFVEGDLLARHVSFSGTIVVDTNTLATARGVVGLHLTDWLALTAGPTWNAWFSTVHTGSRYAPGGGAVVHEEGRFLVRSWPGWQLGVQLLPRRDRRADSPTHAEGAAPTG